MILNKIKAIFFLAVLTMLSCAEDTSEKRAEYDELFKEVLEVHDEVMPKMGDISSFSQQLDIMADTSKTPHPYQETKAQLQEADSLMMTWMRSFSDEFVKNKTALKKMNNEELQKQIAALEEELDEVEAVKQAINSSLEKARTLTQQ